jgi:hypothetical protein
MAAPRFTTDTGLTVELISLTCTGGPVPATARDHWLWEGGGGDGRWFHVRTPSGLTAGFARTLTGLADAGVATTDTGLASAILDQPAVAAALGIDPDTIKPARSTR